MAFLCVPLGATAGFRGTWTAAYSCQWCECWNFIHGIRDFMQPPPVASPPGCSIDAAFQFDREAAQADVVSSNAEIMGSFPVELEETKMEKVIEDQKVAPGILTMSHGWIPMVETNEDSLLHLEGRLDWWKRWAGPSDEVVVCESSYDIETMSEVQPTATSRAQLAKRASDDRPVSAVGTSPPVPGDAASPGEKREGDVA